MENGLETRGPCHFGRCRTAKVSLIFGKRARSTHSTSKRLARESTTLNDVPVVNVGQEEWILRAGGCEEISSAFWSVDWVLGDWRAVPEAVRAEAIELFEVR